MTGAAGQVSGNGTENGPQKPRSSISYLLHALNQPLTGLQCSLELATARPRSAHEYVRALEEALDLTMRARTLVEAVRELSDTEAYAKAPAESIFLNTLLEVTADELAPIAAARNICIQVRANAEVSLQGERTWVANLVFRTLDSVLSLADDGSELSISASPERDRACLSVLWKQILLPEHSPFSRSELGLLITQAGWERLGGECSLEAKAETKTFTCHLPFSLSDRPTIPVGKEASNYEIEESRGGNR
jgi:hypothetical protein